MPADQNQHFDIVLVGAGLSSWLLLEALAKNPNFHAVQIAVLSDGQAIERSWCFWDEALPHPFDGMIERSWSNLAFRSDQFEQSTRLHSQQYHYIPGTKLFNYFTTTFLAQHPNIRVFEDKVHAIHSESGRFLVAAQQHNYRANQVYNSAFLGQKPNIEVWQHFSGWFIETKNPCFAPDQAELMDFNVPQTHGCSFMYLLPLSETRALVELTFFSPQVLDAATYEATLENYIGARFGNDYVITARERGQIPMQQGVFHHRGASGEINIGTLAGMVKPSTGYAFQRIREDSATLAAAYFKTNAPKRSSERSRFAFYDALLLWILRNHPEAGKPIFTQLFKHCKTERILRFMDQRTTIWEEIAIFMRLPIPIFLKALLFHILPVNAGSQPSTQTIHIAAKRA